MFAALPRRAVELQSIQDVHYEAHSLDIEFYPGMRCNEEFFCFTSDIEIPNFDDLVDVLEIGDGLEWKFDIPEEYEDHLSFTSASRTTNLFDSYKLRHEFVSECFGSGDTDVPLWKIFGAKGDDADSLSPDFGFIDERGVYHFLEIGTTSAVRVDQMEKTAADKLFKYKLPILSRCDDVGALTVSVLTVVIVGHNRVISNIQLRQNIVNELIMRMNIMKSIENVAKKKGIVWKIEESETRRELMKEMINLKISKVEVKEVDDSDNAIVITHEYYDKIMTHKADKTEILSDFLTIVDSKKEEIKKEMLKTDQQVEEDFEKIVDSFMKEDNSFERRSDLKPIVNLPFIIPNKTDPSALPKVRRFICCQEKPLITNIWNAAMNSMDTNPDWHEDNLTTLRAEAYCVDEEVVRKYQQERKEKSTKYHRVDVGVDLDEDDMRELQKDGVWAKKTRCENWRKARLIQQRRAFSHITDTTDIGDLLSNNSGLFEKSKFSNTEGLDMSLDMIKLSNDIIGNDSEGLNFVNDILSTKIGKFTDWVTELALELAISNKQHCKKNFMILKKLRNYDVYVLLLPTTSSSHCFFSLCFPRYDKEENKGLSNSTCFRTLYKSGNSLFTDFVSVRLDKLENLASISSTLISMSAYWCHHYELLPSIDEFKNNSEVSKMTLFSLLVALEDKAETEETITLSRYMYMELLKASVTAKRPMPSKMIKKMNNKPRSRLNLYCIKKLIREFRIMHLFPPKRILVYNDTKTSREESMETDNSPPDDNWGSLNNWVTGAPTKRFSKVVNLFYIGYLKNKNEMSQSNSDLQLISKALEEEFKIDYDNRGNLYGDKKDSKPGKEFSLNHLVFGCDRLEESLKKSLGADFKEKLKDEILEALSKQLTHEIATLKASSSISHDDLKKSFDSSEIKDEPRKKVIEAIFDDITKMGLNPMLSIEKMIEEIKKSSGGVIADLFKKQQHGGLREIYVLTIKSRMVQLFIETVSRVLCSHFEEETLTHPKNKLIIIDEHKRKSAKIANKRECLVAEMNSSSDKTRWNQNFIMTAMCVPLFRLTHTDFHGVIQEILNLWARKKLRIPSSVLHLITNGQHLSSEVYEELYKLFWNRSHQSPNSYKIFQKNMNKKFVSLTSGMMQGILHYTSSLLHLTFLYSCKSVASLILRRNFPDCKFLLSCMCSSDDSGFMITGFSPSHSVKLDENLLKMLRSIELCLESFTEMCNYYCMTESVKSTISVPNYIEFNSEFVCGNTLSVPVIKMVAACNNITETESLVKRFQNLYNLISDVFNNGLPAKYTHICQISQGLLHYKTMGESVNPLYPDYFELTDKIKHPKFGFFIMDTQYCPGLLGYTFSLWNHLKVTNNMSIIKKGGLVNNLEQLGDGSVIDSLVIPNGDLIRWKKLVGKLRPDKFTTEEEISKFFDEHSELLFSHPENEEDLKIKLFLKSLMPGVAKSMNRGNAFIQALALSVFSINTHCAVKKTISSYVECSCTKIKSDTVKTSILAEMRKEISSMSERNLKREASRIAKKEERDRRIIEEEERELAGITNQSERKRRSELIRKRIDFTIVTEEEKIEKACFPNKERYEDALKIINSFKGALLVRRHNFRYRKTNFIIQPKSILMPLTLCQTLRKCWYGHNVRVSTNVYRRCLDYYILLFPWISTDGFKETLESSPFITHSELYAFISTNSSPSRRVIKVGPSIFSNKFTGQMVQIIAKSQSDGYVLRRPKDKDSTGSFSELEEEFLTKLTLSLTIPDDRVRTLKTKQVLGEPYRLYDDVGSIPNLSDKLQRVAYIQAYHNKEINDEEIVTQLRGCNKGFFVTYTRPQKRIVNPISQRVSWQGSGIATVIYDDMLMKFTLEDEYVTKVVFKDFRKIRDHGEVLRYIIRDILMSKPVPNGSNLTAVALYKNNRFYPPGSIGLPIFEDKNLESTVFYPRKISLSISHSMISLIYSTNAVSVPIISYRSNVHDLNNKTQVIEGVDKWDCWINQKSWSAKSATAALLTEKTIHKDKATKSPVARWLKSTLLHRLNYKKMGGEMVDIATTLVDSEIHEEEDKNFEVDWNALQTSMMGLDDELPGLRNVDHFVVSVVHDEGETNTYDMIAPELREMIGREGLEMEEGYAELAMSIRNPFEPHLMVSDEIVTKNLMSFMYSHPMWDNFINDVDSRFPRLWRMTLSNIVAPDDNRIQEILFWLLDIKPKERVKSYLETHFTQEELSNIIQNAEAERESIIEECEQEEEDPIGIIENPDVRDDFL